jgi:corrinoid protein of di/trimethylamine methyltransferase
MADCVRMPAFARRNLMPDQFFDLMKQSIIDGDPERARELSLAALEKGIQPLEAINRGFVLGLNVVGEQFAAGELFLPDLVLAGEAMKAAVAILEPELRKTGSKRELLGKVVLGTVKGDIHEIGKTLVATMLSASGFEVFDLGVDVPFETFALKAKELHADIVGVSALLTTTMTGQRDVVESLQRQGLRPQVKLLIGGAPVTESWANEIGADGYGKDAMEAVALAKKLMSSKSRELA